MRGITCTPAEYREPTLSHDIHFQNMRVTRSTRKLGGTRACFTRSSLATPALALSVRNPLIYMCYSRGAYSGRIAALDYHEIENIASGMAPFPRKYL